ncbi:MAG: ATP synthase F1 subunit epsilon [Patescibacteria group bacterium]
MSKQIEFKIVTPERVLYQEMVEAVSIPTIDGQITILPNHIPLLAAVRAGEVMVKKAGKEEFFSVTRGIAEIDGHTITFLTDAAERAEALDEQRAEEARVRAQALMSEKRQDAEGYADAVAELERALSRVKIARKRRHGSSAGPGSFNQ